MREDLIPIAVFLGGVAFIIWLLTFGVAWMLGGMALFVACIVLLFSGAIGPALACLLLCPICFAVAGVIIEAKEKK